VKGSARGRWHALWLFVPFACSQEEPLPQWEPSSRGGDSGDLTWSPFGVSFATGQQVSVDVSLHFSKTTCTEASGCDSGGCFTEERTAALRSVAFSCEGAGCSIVETIELDSSVRVTVQGTRSGRAVLRGRGKDGASFGFYGGESHLDFHDPKELVFLRRPLAVPGTTHALLAGSAFEWCLSVRATDATGEAIELWAKNPLPTLTITGPVVATLISPPPGPAGPYEPRARYVCHAYRAPEAGDAVITSELNQVEARALLAVRAPETAISAVIRSFRGVETLPVWMPVEEEPAGFSEALARLEGTAQQNNLGLFVSTLTLSDGSTSFGGVGAMTLGPSGVATLLDAGVGWSSDTNLRATYGTTSPGSDMPHVTRSVFSVATHAPGRATLRLAVGSADLSIPVEVAGSAGAGGSGGSAGAHGNAGETGTGGAGGEAGGPVAGESGSGDDTGGAAGAF